MKVKYIKASNLPPQINLLAPFVVYTLVDYWSLPTWVFATWMTLWVILVVLQLIAIIIGEAVDVVGDNK